MLHVRTPLWTCPRESAAWGRPVRLKMEAFQPSASFKLRGVGRLAVEAVAGGATRLVSSSGGNAGYAAAWAGKHLGVPVDVVVPSTTPEFMRRRLELIGATVHVAGQVWDAAHARAEALAEETRGVLRDAVLACARFLDEHRILVEPACGAALAALHDGAALALAGSREIVVVVCGGAVVTRAALTGWIEALGA